MAEIASGTQLKDLAARIASVRSQVCPRTAYASAGSTARQLNVLVMSGQMDNELIESIVATGEFDSSKEVRCDQGDIASLTTTGGVYLILFGEDGELEMALDMTEKLIVDKQVPLVFIYGGASTANTIFTNARIDSQREMISTAHNQFEQAHLLSCYASNALPSSSSSKSRKVDQYGSQGQPAVASRDQFRYLWSRAYSLGAEVGMMDCGKQRVLQRLADRVDESGQKWTPVEWDMLVGEALKGGADDFGIYSMIRKKITGRSLEDDLVVNLDDSQKTHDPAAADAEGAMPGADDEDGDGRAAFMVKMTLECVPDDTKGLIGSLLDYGCAEGAITAELGKQLHLPASRVYGADVRSIPSEGFTFIQLQEESPKGAPEVGQLLPGLKDKSIMFVTSAMVMHHVRYPLVAMRELRRVIHPKGMLVMREHHCDSAEMAAFLDITHGLYSLAWSVPLEWPKFLEEYTAWYRSQEDWDQLMASAGFIRIIGHFRIDKHYNAAKHSKLRERDSRVSNVIKAYYAAYTPDPAYQGHTPAASAAATAAATAAAAAAAGVVNAAPSSRRAAVNSIWGSVGADDDAVKEGKKEKEEGEEGHDCQAAVKEEDVSGNARSKRARTDQDEEGSSAEAKDEELRESKKKKEETDLSVVENVLEEMSSSSLDISSEEIDVFESRSHRGHFYVPLQGGKTQWVSMFYLSELGDPSREMALPVHPEKSLIPAGDHPVNYTVKKVGFLNERHTRVMMIRKIVYAS